MQNVIYSEYFNRYASCPDTVRFYESYSSENQKLWVEKSEAIIQEYVKKLPTFKSFHEAYAFLAKRRHEIAVQLKQRNEEGHSELYGSFRDEGDHLRKAISAGEGEPFWKWQKQKIFELTYQLIEPIKQDKNFYEDNKEVLTPHLEKYTEWFYAKAFQGYRMLDSDESISFVFR